MGTHSLASATVAKGASANLDVLRSIAVLLVLYDHVCRHYFLDRTGWFAVVDVGLFGVLLFFVHTSLVLMYSMQRSGLGGWGLLKNFHIRRFFRIYPLSVAAVLTAVVLQLHANGRQLEYGVRPGGLELFSNLALIQNLTYSKSIIGPLWSLPIEVQMYLLLPFLFMWRKRSVWWLLAIWGACGLLGHFPLAVPRLAWFSLLLFIPNFLPGVIAFTLPERRVIPSVLWTPFVLGLALAYTLYPARRFGAELCLLLGVAIPLFKEISWRPLRWLSNRIATYSYGIYLGHSFCIWLALTKLNSWPLFVVLMLVVPVALYHWLEKPALKFGVRLAERASAPKLRAVAVAAD
jgi:peptidoglycan/LPS O-acetylase OafA/YrhL